MIDPRSALDAIGQLPDVEIDIAGAALQLARIDAPHADHAAAIAHLSTLAREAAAAAADLPSTSVAARAGALAALITGRHGYAGDTATYDDPANANLIHVINRRRGLPVALGVIWMHCARAAGWAMHGLDFPGHFVVALEGGAPPPRASSRPTPKQGKRTAVIDVFAGGTTLEAEDLAALLRRVEGPQAELRPGVLAPLSTRRILLRLQENIRARRLRGDDTRGALSCTEDMLRLAPDHATLWRDAARMHTALEQPAGALRCWQQALTLQPEGDAARTARAEMDQIRSRLN